MSSLKFAVFDCSIRRKKSTTEYNKENRPHFEQRRLQFKWKRCGRPNPIPPQWEASAFLIELHLVACHPSPFIQGGGASWWLPKLSGTQKPGGPHPVPRSLLTPLPFSPCFLTTGLVPGGWWACVVLCGLWTPEDSLRGLIDGRVTSCVGSPQYSSDVSRF